MCLFSRRDIHADIGENGRQPIDPSAAGWEEMRAPVSLAALRANGAVRAGEPRGSRAANDVATAKAEEDAFRRRVS